jgi:hypothetical protein
MSDIMDENDSMEDAEGEDEAVFGSSPNVGATKETDTKFLKARSHMREILKSVSKSLDFSRFANI